MNEKKQAPHNLNDRLVLFANALIDDAQADAVPLDVKIDVFKAVTAFLASANKRGKSSDEEVATAASFDSFRKRVTEAVPSGC